MSKLIEILAIPIARTIIEPPYEYLDTSIDMKQIEIKIHKSYRWAWAREVFTFGRKIANNNQFRKSWEQDKDNLLSDLAKTLTNLCKKENILSVRMLTNNLTDTEWEELINLLHNQIGFEKRKSVTFDEKHNTLEWDAYYIRAINQ